ncbi:hypothetical protein L249_8741 [Ophiocordyceps polyrhachis-furcata BCC 54312]|uniref:Uncharacterized protein n=1 Tax=Ophiocordyceps polyrhachis-furcata BCC 54312 TaxID=1330021 RepID=A0A367L6K5_9HYPO|nr:hypothetical protein L249_8741 [Ophiocordyceps polyrhachis-furcata BCC 54312]
MRERDAEQKDEGTGLKEKCTACVSITSASLLSDKKLTRERRDPDHVEIFKRVMRGCAPISTMEKTIPFLCEERVMVLAQICFHY